MEGLLQPDKVQLRWFLFPTKKSNNRVCLSVCPALIQGVCEADEEQKIKFGPTFYILCPLF